MDWLTPSLFFQIGVAAMAVAGAYYMLKVNQKNIIERLVKLEKSDRDWRQCFSELRCDIRELIGELRGKGVINGKGDSD